LRYVVYGVDTPEKGFRGQCDSEKQRGEAASVFTKNLINASQKRQVVLYGWDKFGGRVLGDIILNGQEPTQLNSLPTALLVNTMVMLNNHGATNMDQTLKDYITRTMAKLESEKQVPKTVEPQVNPNNYEVWPEQARRGQQ
jgi:endonuclease YncB( thermonuclease family)